MSERLNLLMTLEDAIARSSIRKRVGIALQLADLFVGLSNQLSEPLVDLFDDLISRLAAEIDSSAQAQLAEQIARVENAPVKITRMLANCSDIEVAYPILAYSNRLDEGSLIRHAQTSSEQHLLAITLRRSLSEALTVALIERGSRPVTLSTVKNQKAQISDALFCSLAEHCERDVVLANVLAARADIVSLLIKTQETTRSRFLATSPRVSEAIDRALTVFPVRPNEETVPEEAASLNDRSPESALDPIQVLAPDPLREAEDDDIFGVTSDAIPADDLSDFAVPDPDTEASDAGRQAVRHRTFLRGCLFFDSGRSSVECMIRDLTVHGAKLIVSAVVNIPSVVDLYIPQKGQKLRAQVAWRTQEEVGVSFPSVSPSPEDQLLSNAVIERVANLEQQFGALRSPLMQIKRAVADKN